MEPNIGQALAAVLTLLVTMRALWYLIWRPYAVARWFARQGIRGPPYRFLVGSLPECQTMLVAGRAKPLDTSSHDCITTVQPFFRKWAFQYGKTFLYWLGPTPALCCTDMDLVKQMFTVRTDVFQKDYLNPSLDSVFGNGVIFASGDDWKRRHKFVHPAFNQETIKEMVREEVVREYPAHQPPTVDALGKLKLLNMLLLETLRLYCPITFIQRKTSSDTILANIKVPKGTIMAIPLLMLHRDKEVWGPDADEFNPMRFQNGISRDTKLSRALLAFSYGPRVCAGQNFAMVEVQIVIATILRSFSFSLSPTYMHKPSNFVTLLPRYGLPLIVRNLQQLTTG